MQIGRLIAKASGSIPRPVTLELGGKNPLFICEDANLDLAVEGIIDAAFGTYLYVCLYLYLANGGQNCCAGSNLYIQKPIYSELVTKLRSRLSQIRIGVPSSLDTDLGPLGFLRIFTFSLFILVDEEQKKRVDGFVSRALASGLELLYQGTIPDGIKNGFFVAPTVFINVPDNSEMYLFLKSLM